MHQTLIVFWRRPKAAIAAATPSLILFPHGSRWRAAEGRLNTLTWFQGAATRKHAPRFKNVSYIYVESAPGTYLQLRIRFLSFSAVSLLPAFGGHQILVYISYINVSQALGHIWKPPFPNSVRPPWNNLSFGPLLHRRCKLHKPTVAFI